MMRKKFKKKTPKLLAKIKSHKMVIIRSMAIVKPILIEMQIKMLLKN